MDLPSRDQEILRATILCYIRTATPVGSRTLTKNTELGLSPATIRNVMADLEELGYLAQPHTSAGRIPTEKAYRVYVNDLLTTGQIDPPDSPPTTIHLALADDLKNTLQETSKLLSLLSHYTGVVARPKSVTHRLKQVEFFRLGGPQVLAVFLMGDGFVHHKRIDLDADPAPEQLRRIADELNTRFSGQDLAVIRERLLEEMRGQKRDYDRLMERVLAAAQGTFTQQAGEVYVEGAGNILGLPEFSDVERMKALFKTFEETYMMSTLIEKSLNTDGVRVFIGSDNAALGANDLSLVVASYRCGEHAFGTLGVLGPMRMEYERVIPLVNRFAALLGECLQDQTGADPGHGDTAGQR
ncbi:MAG: heat-inducible transcriptional repressor HrcA [Nitrospirota bacterium]